MIMRAYALFAFIFLYLPIALIVAFSFNAGTYAMDWQGFSVGWYGKAFSNPLVVRSLLTSVAVAITTSIASTTIGTLTAIGLQRASRRVVSIYEGLNYVAIIMPGIIIGISTLISFVTIFNFANPVLAPFGIKLQLGIWSIVSAHVLFGMAIVYLMVRARLTGMDRSLIEASQDLGATPFGTFRQVLIPTLSPAMFAGGLLAFVFSFDDFAVAYFVAGPNSTLPIYVFASVRRGVTPEVNAVGSVMLLTSMFLLFTSQMLLKKANMRPSAG